MQPFFTDEQLKNMSRENLAQVITLMQEHQTKLETKQKIGVELAHPSDRFWNKESLEAAGMAANEASTIACDLKELSQFI